MLPLQMRFQTFEVGERKWAGTKIGAKSFNLDRFRLAISQRSGRPKENNGATRLEQLLNWWSTPTYGLLELGSAIGIPNGIKLFLFSFSRTSGRNQTKEDQSINRQRAPVGSDSLEGARCVNMYGPPIECRMQLARCWAMTDGTDSGAISRERLASCWSAQTGCRSLADSLSQEPSRRSSVRSAAWDCSHGTSGRMGRRRKSLGSARFGTCPNGSHYERIQKSGTISASSGDQIGLS